MNKLEMETLVWSYLDGDIDVKDKVRVDRLKDADADFALVFQEILEIHKDLRGLVVEEISPEFSADMKDSLLSQFAKAEKPSVEINPLFVFGICLAAMGMAFFYTSGNVAAVYLFGLDLDYSLGFDFAQFDGLPVQLHWSYFLIFTIAPIVFFIDQIMESKVGLNQLPLF